MCESIYWQCQNIFSISQPTITWGAAIKTAAESKTVKRVNAIRHTLSRTMAGLPSQLGYQIINDICRKPVKLEGCCCAGAALAIWSNQLPVQIRAHISNMSFTKETYKTVFEAADRVFNSARQVNVAVAAVTTSHNETLPAFTPQNQPTAEVAAIAGKGKNKKNKKPKKPRSQLTKHASVPDKIAEKFGLGQYVSIKVKKCFKNCKK